MSYHEFVFSWSEFLTLECYLFAHRTLEFAAQYDATKIAVINIKDLDGVKNAINLITADGSKIFQCISPTAKVSIVIIQYTLSRGN